MGLKEQMKFKDVNLQLKNDGLVSILMNSNQLFLIDANIFIPPDRSKENKNIKPVDFEFYRKYWIEPFIDTFKPIGIHDAVYREFESNNIKALIKNRKNDIPPSIYIYKYLYYLTKNDKNTNPSWGEFIEKMNGLYCEEINMD